MKREKYRGEQAGIDVKLQPGSRRKQWEERKFFTSIIERQRQDEAEQGPAGKIANPRPHTRIPSVETDHECSNCEQKSETEPTFFGERRHLFVHAASASRSFRLSLTRAPWGHAR